jgi:hypothetical protein
MEKNEMGRACRTYGERWGVYRVLVEKTEKIDCLADLSVDGRVILRGIFRKLVVRAWTRWRWHRIRTDGGTCECGNEPWVSTKCGEFLD